MKTIRLNILKYLSLVSIIVLFSSCKTDDEFSKTLNQISLDIPDRYIVKTGTTVNWDLKVSNEKDFTFSWVYGNDVIANASKLNFNFTELGERTLVLNIENKAGESMTIRKTIFVTKNEKKEVLGYLPAGRLSYPDTAHYWDNVTIIALAFARVTDGGILNASRVLTDFKDISAAAHKHGVRVILSIAHETGNKMPFSKAIVDKGQRDNIVTQAIALMNELNLDGIDVDFESWDETNATKAEKSLGLLDLWSSFRTQLPKGYLLTAALAMSPLESGSYTYGMLQFLDYANVMTYDKTGPWGNTVGHHAPYDYFTKGINLLVKLGFQKNKILPGIPFYGIKFPSYPSAAGATHLTYKAIIQQYPGAENTNYIPSAYLYYDGLADVSQKAQYVVDTNLGGIIIWELTQDYFEDTSKSLLYEINKIL